MFYPFDFKKWRNFFETEEQYMLFETLSADEFRPLTYLFYRPEMNLVFKSGDDWQLFVEKLKDLREKGFFLGIYAKYELSFEFEEKFQHLRQKGSELLRVMVCKNPLIFDHTSKKISGASKDIGHVLSSDEQEFFFSNLHLKVDQDAYEKKFLTLQKHLQEGRVYQVNLTDFWEASFKGSAVSLYQNLRERQPVGYASLVKCEGVHTLSFSPELFFRINKKGKVVVRPMKGTAPRFSNREEDAQSKHHLSNDLKNRSENVMIVDLLRNDLGKICKTGTVHLQSLFDIEPYRHVWQMTSSIAGFKSKETSIWDVFQELFPCGSVTGAPKIESMKIISELEEGQRGIYTGALGFIKPDNQAIFNVPIRTLTIKGDKLQMGVGSGVVNQSLCDQEYQEWLIKSHFFTEVSKPFDLLETLRWEKGEYLLIDLHLTRMKESSKVLGFSFDLERIVNFLNSVSKEFDERCAYKVRLKMNQKGMIKCKTQVLDKEEPSEPLKLKLSNHVIYDHNPFLYHKTSRRDLYKKERSQARKEGFFDVIFCNQNGLLCEGSISNIYIEREGEILTPRQSAGLLNGVYREYLIKENPSIREVLLVKKDLLTAKKIFVSNAVIGFKEARLFL
ncbi:hypothetical protein AB834_04565 [PVC group bacterium (ex Bugula neritina AB1)]|nr:hypothetical protein AB834_04565 [PVC group bacterium (ex Bugula neritina AB1)]